MTTTTPKPQTAPAQIHEWPGAFGAFKPSREVVRRSLSTVVLTLVIWLIASTILSSVLHRSTFLNELVSVALGAYFTAAQVHIFLSGMHDKRVELGEAFRAAGSFFWNMLLLNILVALSVIGGLLLLIVPGLIILPRLVLAPYFLVDQKLGAVAAYKASWNATKGHSGKVWGIIGVAFLMALPTVTVIGIIATVYLWVMYAAVNALLYRYISAKHVAAK
jgi:uncharacterized membrane protein